jgi:hypothetical protein
MVGNSQWFRDAAGRKIKTIEARLPAETLAVARRRFRDLTLEDLTRVLHAELGLAKMQD